VKPSLTEAAFKKVDEKTVEVIARLLDISDGERDDQVNERIRLPGRLSGLGIVSYEIAAAPAFIGCIQAVGSRLAERIGEELSLDDIPGAREAYTELRMELGEHADLPDESALFKEAKSTRPRGQQGTVDLGSIGAPKRKAKLQWKLTAAKHEKIYARLQEQATTKEEKYIMEVTSNPTCADFLFVRGFRRTTLARGFKIAVRRFLGIQVTGTICNIQRCSNREAHGNGDHSYHASSRVTIRHTYVKNALGRVFRELHNAGTSSYTCHFETSMSTLGYSQKPEAKDKSDAVVDFYLLNMETGHKFCTDVTVAHPSFGEDESVENLSKLTLEKAVARKYNRYIKNFEVTDKDIIPLVFDSYGGYARVTYDFLRNMSLSIANEDHVLAAKLFRNIRDRVAVALHTGNAEIINWLNSKNQFSSKRKA